jgi:hypothetical protein
MPSKLTGILAAGGTAIITADEDIELGRLVRNNRGIAVLVPPENQGLFQKALQADCPRRKTVPGQTWLPENMRSDILPRMGFYRNRKGAVLRDHAMNRTETGSRGNA